MKIKFGSDELAAAEKKATCEHPKERVVEGSAAPKQMSLTLRTFRCRPDSEEDPEPDFRRDTDALTACRNVDTVNVRCALKEIRRDSNFKPRHDHVFTCKEREQNELHARVGNPERRLTT